MFFKKKNQKISWEKIFIVAVSVFLVAFIGSLLTDVGPWYDQLPAISIQPPKWLFGPVWTTLFVLTGIAAVLVWNQPKVDEKTRHAALFLFAANGILNVFWSYLFFTQKNIPGAFIEIIVLWLSIAGMIYFSEKINKKAAWMLVPYLLWVTFAGFLNYSYVVAMK